MFRMFLNGDPVRFLDGSTPGAGVARTTRRCDAPPSNGVQANLESVSITVYTMATAAPIGSYSY